MGFVKEETLSNYSAPTVTQSTHKDLVHNPQSKEHAIITSIVIIYCVTMALHACALRINTFCHEVCVGRLYA